MKKERFNLVTLFLVFGLILGSFPAALAQEAQEEEKDVFVLDEIVVTAQRREQDVQDVPIAMTALSSKALATYRLEQTAQLASMVPNLNVLQAYGEHTAPVITIRGVNTQGWSFGDSATVAVYSDDLVLTNVFSHGFAMFDLDRVEVLRGPQGTLFGRNSTAGAIHFVSAGPGDELAGYARLTLAKFNKRRVEAAIGGPSRINSGCG